MAVLNEVVERPSYIVRDGHIGRAGETREATATPGRRDEATAKGAPPLPLALSAGARPEHHSNAAGDCTHREELRVRLDASYESSEKVHGSRSRDSVHSVLLVCRHGQ